MSSRTVRVATRGSLLALTQTKQTVALLKKANPSIHFEIIEVKTTGDKDADRPLTNFGGTGIFIKEIEQILLADKAELAIHSCKDVPAEISEGLSLAAFPKRASPADVLLTKNARTLHDLPALAKIGTGSPRRRVQLKAQRPDCQFMNLRGNLDTRIRKLDEGQYDAIVVAAAGMLRLARTFSEKSILPEAVCLPAVGQGALAIQCRNNNDTLKQIARSANDPDTEIEIGAERVFMNTLGAGCKTPMGALAKRNGENLRMNGMIGDLQSGKIVRDSISTDRDDYKMAGKKLAEQLLKQCTKMRIRINHG